MATVTALHPFDPNQVNDAAAETLYTAPTTPSSVVIRGRTKFANTTAGPVTVSVWAVPSAGSAADTNALVKDYSIAANSYLELDWSLTAGGTLQAQAGAATSITASSVYGLRYQ